MILVRWLAIAAALATAVPSPALAEDARGLAPSSPWALDYDDDSCALRRMFGEGDNRAYLELRRFGPNGTLQTTVARSGRRVVVQPDVRYRFSEDSEWLGVGRTLAISMADGFRGVIFGSTLFMLDEDDLPSDPRELEAYFRGLDPRTIEADAAAAARVLMVRGAFSRDLVLRVGSLKTPIAGLNSCIDELMTHWNIDVEAHKTLSRPATPINLPEVGSMIDYPPLMLRRNMPGIVNIRLAIDERGAITGCRIQMPLSDPAFEETSCVDVQHALEFEPALDKDGKPIASYWVTRVIFQIGGR